MLFPLWHALLLLQLAPHLPQLSDARALSFPFPLWPVLLLCLSFLLLVIMLLRGVALLVFRLLLLRDEALLVFRLRLRLLLRAKLGSVSLNHFKNAKRLAAFCSTLLLLS